MHEAIRIIADRKKIPSDITSAGSPTRLEVLDAVGTSLVRAGWQKVLHIMPAGGRIRLLLLDPDGWGVIEGSTSDKYWWHDTAKARADIRAAVETIAAVARDRGLGLEARYYDGLPVSRYVRCDQRTYQSGYPMSNSHFPLPVAVLDPGTVLARRAEREFDVLWATRSRVAIAVPPAPGDLPACATKQAAGWKATPVPASGFADDPVDLVSDRKAVPAHAVERLSSLTQVDIIDVAGAAQVDAAWQEMVRGLAADRMRMRVLLLDPDGQAARSRAAESTRWQGDDAGLRAKIRRNIARLRELAVHLELELAIRVYDNLPISRYVRLDDTVYQSVYPQNESAKSLPIAVLSTGTMLGQRAVREFDVLWTRMSRAADGGFS